MISERYEGMGPGYVVLALGRKGCRESKTRRKQWEWQMRKGKGWVKITGSKVCSWGAMGGVEHPNSSHCSLDVCEVPMDAALPRGFIGKGNRYWSLSKLLLLMV